MTGAWLPRFACPECHHPAPVDAAGGWWCAACDVRFERRAGVYRFLTPWRAAAFEAFMAQYRLVRQREGRARTDSEYFRGLPAVPSNDPEAVHWRVRQESYTHLLRHAVARLPAGRGDHSGSAAGRLRVLDIGAGNAWLSHRLACGGHQVVALDRLDEAGDGLGAARHYPIPFTTVQADFDALPFEPAQFDVAVFNGSLHYSANPAATLSEAQRVLAQGGVVAVMDSPMFAAAADGRAMLDDQADRLQQAHDLGEVLQPGVGFLTFGGLDSAAASIGLRPQFVPTRGPLTWRVGRLLARARLGRAPAAFGVWVAQ